MVDGFHWTRVTSKQLRFLYETITQLPTPPHMYELAARIDAARAAGEDAENIAPLPASPSPEPDAAARNQPSGRCVNDSKEHKP